MFDLKSILLTRQ